MYICIAKDIVVESSRIVMVIDKKRDGTFNGDNSRTRAQRIKEETLKTAIILSDGNCLFVNISKKAVIRRLKQGRLDQTGVDKSV